MKRRLIQDEDGVYMIDEDCIRRKEEQERQKEMRWQKQKKGKPSVSLTRHYKKED